MKRAFSLLLLACLFCACSEKPTTSSQTSKPNEDRTPPQVQADTTAFNQSEFAPFKESEFTQWQPITDHQMAFDAIDTTKNQVCHVEGRNFQGLSQFRMIIRPKTDVTVHHKVRYWMTDRHFWEYGISYQRKGYKRMSLQLYKDSSDITRYQAVWVKKESN